MLQSTDPERLRNKERLSRDTGFFWEEEREWILWVDWAGGGQVGWGREGENTQRDNRNWGTFQM